MTYKIYSVTNGITTYARIDDDGLCRLTCVSEYPQFQEWLAEGNTPLPADESSEG